MLRLAFDFIITWRETRTRPNAYSDFFSLQEDSDDNTTAPVKEYNNTGVTLLISFFINIIPTIQDFVPTYHRSNLLTYVSEWVTDSHG